jgi:hypothetical protein
VAHGTFPVVDVENIARNRDQIIAAGAANPLTFRWG